MKTTNCIILLSLVFGFGLFMVGCGSSETSDQENTTYKVVEMEETDDDFDELPSSGFFGAEFDIANAIPSTQVVSTLAEQDSAQVKLAGKIEKVCKMKGCWMTIDIGKEEPMRVRFKDYEFFVPKDADGKEVVFEGVVRKEFISKEMLQHYAEDAGKSKEEIEAITAGKEEWSFTASGVFIPEEGEV
ncbi:MAG: DUF4920 domain-containing protein [Cyclobacteriaceae bacterium]|nr:DUF4920 domain-containing protein [Cyclobacteriaceae bacterium]MCH8515939.1 DUF4920 domain-containing protein [Cyclobacteriaceae bacterium]